MLSGLTWGVGNVISLHPKPKLGGSGMGFLGLQMLGCAGLQRNCLGSFLKLDQVLFQEPKPSIPKPKLRSATPFQPEAPTYPTPNKPYTLKP